MELFVVVDMELLHRFIQNANKIITKPYFVKVGANDGVANDPCGQLLLQNEFWRGLLIEPVPYCFEKLSAVYHDTSRFVIQSKAVSNFVGKKRFYYVDKDANLSHDLPDWYDQLASFDKQHIVKHLNGILEPFIKEVDIDCETLSEILSANDVSKVSLLHIDTEGHDLKVLQSLNFDQVLPSCILIEHRHLSKSDKDDLVALLNYWEYKIKDYEEDFLAFHSKLDFCDF
jgi:FkbM family methyltransferase